MCQPSSICLKRRGLAAKQMMQLNKIGEELSGIVSAETTSELTLKIGNNPPRIIKRAAIKEMEMLPSGMMSMKDVLDKSQLRDLISYLITLKK